MVSLNMKAARCQRLLLSLMHAALRAEQPRTRTIARALAPVRCIVAASSCCFTAITVAVLQTHSEHYHENDEHENKQGQQNHGYSLESQ